VQSKPIVGFGVGDHQIRVLMRFIEMTSRESENENDVQVAGASNYKRWLDLTQGGLNFLCFEFELGNVVLLRGLEDCWSIVQPNAQNPRITFSYPAKTASQKSLDSFYFG
jgi:hypothetical protein